MVEYNDFMNRMMFMPLICSGQSSVSDRQDQVIIKAYEDAFALLAHYAEHSNKLAFERVFWAVKHFMPKESVQQSLKHPEMYAKIENAQKQFAFKVKESKQNNAKLWAYWRSCEQNVK